MEKQRCTTIPTVKSVHAERRKKSKAYRTQRYLLGKYSQQEKRQESQKMYNSPAWVNTRNAKIQENPLCELSLVEHIIEPAEHVHHLIKFLDQPDEAVKHELFLDPDNLLSLSTEMHMAIHYAPERLTEKQREWLDAKKEEIFEKYVKNGKKIVYTTDFNENPRKN